MKNKKQSGKTSLTNKGVKSPKRKRGVPKGTRLKAAQLCTAMRPNGKQCQRNAVAGYDVCPEHLGEFVSLPATQHNNGRPLLEKRPAPPIPLSTKNLVPEEDWEGFQVLWNRLYEDFDLNQSSDYVSVEFVCLSHIQAKQARAVGDTDALKIHEGIIRAHMNCLKATRIARQSPNVNVNVNLSPAAWAAKLISEGETLTSREKDRLKRLEPTAVDAEWEDIDDRS